MALGIERLLYTQWIGGAKNGHSVTSSIFIGCCTVFLPICINALRALWSSDSILAVLTTGGFDAADSERSDRDGLRAMSARIDVAFSTSIALLAVRSAAISSRRSKAWTALAARDSCNSESNLSRKSVGFHFSPALQVSVVGATTGGGGAMTVLLDTTAGVVLVAAGSPTLDGRDITLPTNSARASISAASRLLALIANADECCNCRMDSRTSFSLSSKSMCLSSSVFLIPAVDKSSIVRSRAVMANGRVSLSRVLIVSIASF